MSEYIKSPLNYIGGKFKILKDIIPTFPESIDNFVDLFAGGLNVGINTFSNTLYVNDQLSPLIEIYKVFREMPLENLLKKIKDRIDEYKLDETNREGYNKLREEYNNTRNTLDLFILACFSFNHQIRFNNNFMFNTPFGQNRSSYNNIIEKNLILFSEKLKEKNIIFSSCDFRFFDFTNIHKGDFVYADPPYIITTGSYNDGNRGFGDWIKKDEEDLLALLEELGDRGVFFALSNVLSHNGRANEILLDWSKNYYIKNIDRSYSNSNYHTRGRNSKSYEVLITNYDYDEVENEGNLFREIK